METSPFHNPPCRFDSDENISIKENETKCARTHRVYEELQQE